MWRCALAEFSLLTPGTGCFPSPHAPHLFTHYHRWIPSDITSLSLRSLQPVRSYGTSATHHRSHDYLRSPYQAEVTFIRFFPLMIHTFSELICWDGVASVSASSQIGTEVKNVADAVRMEPEFTNPSPRSLYSCVFKSHQAWFPEPNGGVFWVTWQVVKKTPKKTHPSFSVNRQRITAQQEKVTAQMYKHDCASGDICKYWRRSAAIATCCTSL